MGIFIDLKKAPDLVDHNILINKLSGYGVRGTPLLLLKSYLTNRFQYVSTGEARSQMLPVETGVLQGSILGSVLFLVYISDLVDYLQAA